MASESMQSQTLKHKLDRYKAFTEWLCFDEGFDMDDIRQITDLIENSIHPIFDIRKHVKCLKHKHSNNKKKDVTC